MFDVATTLHYFNPPQEELHMSLPTPIVDVVNNPLNFFHEALCSECSTLTEVKGRYVRHGITKKRCFCNGILRLTGDVRIISK